MWWNRISIVEFLKCFMLSVMSYKTCNRFKDFNLKKKIVSPVSILKGIHLAKINLAKITFFFVFQFTKIFCFWWNEIGWHKIYCIKLTLYFTQDHQSHEVINKIRYIDFASYCVFVFMGWSIRKTNILILAIL